MDVNPPHDIVRMTPTNPAAQSKLTQEARAALKRMAAPVAGRLQDDRALLDFVPLTEAEAATLEHASVGERAEFLRRMEPKERLARMIEREGEGILGTVRIAELVRGDATWDPSTDKGHAKVALACRDACLHRVVAAMKAGAFMPALEAK